MQRRPSSKQYFTGFMIFRRRLCNHPVVIASTTHLNHRVVGITTADIFCFCKERTGVLLLTSVSTALSLLFLLVSMSDPGTVWMDFMTVSGTGLRGKGRMGHVTSTFFTKRNGGQPTHPQAKVFCSGRIIDGYGQTLTKQN